MKTKIMFTGASRKGECNFLDVALKDITIVDNFVYLGVNIDCKYNFEKFISNKVSKCNGRFISFAKIIKMLDVNTILLIYKQTILPVVVYVLILVDSSTQMKICKLQPLQNRAIRIIARRNNHVCTAEMDELHLKKLNQRVNYLC